MNTEPAGTHECQYLRPADVHTAVQHMMLARPGLAHPDSRVWGVPRGGVPIALQVCAMGRAQLATAPSSATHFVDDIYDSGRTEGRYAKQWPGVPFHTAFDKRDPRWAGVWLTMPWERGDDGKDHSITDSITRLLQHIGEDPTRDGLRETPERVARAYLEWCGGYKINPADVLKTFDSDGADEMVIRHNIPVRSMCEHHMAHITGVAHVGYIPNGRIVGLSKLDRLVDIFARRLQVQERLTVQVANALMQHLAPVGVGVLIRASHHCMSSRGVLAHDGLATTSAMRGALRENDATRAEFLALCRDAEASR